MSNQGDHNLLFGMLALQLDFVTREQMVRAFQEWVANKSKSVGQILCSNGDIDNESEGIISALVTKSLSRAGGSVEKTLSVFGSINSTTMDDLRSLQDTDLDNSLAFAEKTCYFVESNKSQGAAREPTASVASKKSSSRFRILRPHAQGGLGKVSVALDEELDREVALKEIRDEHANTLESRERFVLEAKITGGLEHPGIIPVYGLGVYEGGQPYYAMRFIRGDSLRDAAKAFHKSPRTSHRRDFQTMDFRRMIRRLVDVCYAMEYAHSRGILHRDLKPANVMLGKYGETMVVDWGLAKTVGRKTSNNPSDEPTLRPLSGTESSQTRMGQAVGTPSFMSPEQASGRLDQMQPASDVYSLGATLFYLLTGNHSVQGDSLDETISNVTQGRLERILGINPNVPKALCAVCEHAMELDPQSRYRSAIDLANDLELWLADAPVSVYAEPVGVRIGRAIRKHRTLATAALTLLVSATVILAGANWIISEKNVDLKVARNLAEGNRRQAVVEKDRAEANLVTARAIALNILEIAETNLSALPGKEGFRESMMDQCYAMFTKVYEESVEDDPQVAEEFAKVARMSGNVKRLVKKYDEARNRLNLAVNLLEGLQQEDNQNSELYDYLLETYRDIGTLEKAAGNMAAAGEALNKAATGIDGLIAKHPGDSKLRRTQGSINLELVGIHVDQHQLEKALRAAQRCTMAYQPLIDAGNPRRIDVVVYLLSVTRQIQMMNRLGRHAEGVKELEQGIPVGRAMQKQSPGRDISYAVGRLLLRSAEGFAEAGRANPQSKTQIKEAKEMFEKLVKDFPETSSYGYFLGDCWRVDGLTLWHLDQPDQARNSFDQAIAVLEPIVDNSDRASYQNKLAETYGSLASFLQAINEGPTARTWIEKAIQLEQLAIKKQPNSLEFQVRLKSFEQTLGELDKPKDN